jgi:hypothetical protein
MKDPAIAKDPRAPRRRFLQDHASGAGLYLITPGGRHF